MLVNFLSRAHKPLIFTAPSQNEKLPPQRREEDDDDDEQIIMIMIDKDELRMSKVQCNLTVFILIVKSLDIASNQPVWEEITSFSSFFLSLSHSIPMHVHR